MKKMTNEEFIVKSKLKHGDLYDYKYTNFTNVRNKIDIICKKHGIFTQIANTHLRGSGCKKCKYDNLKLKFSSNTDDFIKKSNIIHLNKYKYINSQYVNSYESIKITCNKHGDFLQKPYKHLSGQGCPKCSGKYKTNEEFIEKSQNIHKNKFSYNLVNYINSKTNVIITCNQHGNFSQLPNNHIQGQGCPKCNTSKSEYKITEFLNNNNIKFIMEHTYIDCCYKRKLPFDFYLPAYNLCIEFDGEQHFKSIKHFGGEKRLLIQKIKDNIKTEYCKNNNIKLLRIPYYDFNNIEKILEKILLT